MADIRETLIKSVKSIFSRRTDVVPTKPEFTEDIAQQLRGEAELGSMYLPDDLREKLERSRSRPAENKGQRTINKNG